MAEYEYENAVNYRVSTWKELAISEKCRIYGFLNYGFWLHSEVQAKKCQDF